MLTIAANAAVLTAKNVAAVAANATRRRPSSLRRWVRDTAPICFSIDLSLRWVQERASLSASPDGVNAALRGERLSLRADCLEPDQPVVGDLAHPTVRDQQVDVPNHLGEGEKGLGDGHVSPELLGDLVGRVRALGDQGEDLLGAAAVQLEALVDQGSVIGDRLAVAREDDLGGQLASAAK